MSFKERWS